MPRGHGRRRGRNPHPYRDPPLQDVQQPHPTIKLKRNNLRHELKKYMLKRALILYPFKGILSTTIVTSCYRFSCYYRFSDRAINSVNPSFTQGLGASEKKILYIYIFFFFFRTHLAPVFIHMTIGIFKEWLIKYFFVHKIVFKAILVF